MPRATNESASDHDLVDAFRSSRDRGAFEELLGRHRSSFSGLKRRWFIPGAETDDLEQEILIGFTKALRDYDVGAGISFGSFAMGCVKRHLITSIRAANRLKHSALNESERFETPIGGDNGGLTVGDRIRSDDPDPAERLIRRNEFEMLGAMLGIGISPSELEQILAHVRVESVPDVAAQLLSAGDAERGQGLTVAEAEVLLYRLLDVPYVEAAEYMGRDPKYVDNCFQRVRRKARHALNAARKAGDVVHV